MDNYLLNSSKKVTFWINVAIRLRPCLVPKIFQDSPSHRILRHMHEALNIDENKN